MMNVSCLFRCPDGSSYTLTRCLNFTLLRERYQAFSTLYAQFLTDDFPETPAEAAFSLNGQLLFDGIIEHSDCIHAGGKFILKCSSRSFTAALIRNQLVPGLHYAVTLQSLMETYALPKITYDTSMPEINYIYVRDNAAMWDSIMAYNFKLNGGFPYIRVPNLLCMTPQTGQEPILLPGHALLSDIRSGDCSEMLSRIDMANAAGEYGSFTRSNPEAASRNIVRVKQILLDKQYVYRPDDALIWRIALSNRRLSSRTVTYSGYCGEDIEDLVQCGDLSARVSRIRITGSKNGIRTEDSFYFDPFCNPL